MKDSKTPLTLSLFAVIIIITFAVGHYLLYLPSRKASEVKEKISANVAPVVEKVLSNEGKTFKIVEIGQNYIKIKGHFFTKTITPGELTEPIPEGTTELMKSGAKYAPLIK